MSLIEQVFNLVLHHSFRFLSFYIRPYRCSYSPSFNLSSLFEEGDERSRLVTHASLYSIVSRLEDIGKVMDFIVRKQDCTVTLEEGLLGAGTKGPLIISAEVFELTPTLVLVEVKKKGGDKHAYDKRAYTGCICHQHCFKINELRNATNGFDDTCLIQGSVYKGCIDGEFYAIKKMKWNAYDELKILQKVNHGNLVRLEGFCIGLEDSTCYLIYEYIENGSLYWWLHNNKNANLSWKTRLRIAIDVSNGLQYIHEHTRPRVVHKI